MTLFHYLYDRLLHDIFESRAASIFTRALHFLFIFNISFMREATIYAAAVAMLSLLPSRLLI